MTDGVDVVSGVRIKRLPAEFRWPGGRHVAIVFNIAYESWSEGKAPGVGPMGNPLPAGVFDTNALSWGHYGQSRGIERLLRVMDRVKLKSSVMTSGILAERAPASIKAIVSAGHDLVAHAFAQDIVPAMLKPEDEKADIIKTTQALESAAGVKPKGWISPRGTPGRNGARYLQEAGYVWQGDVFDDDRPYVQDLPGGPFVGIPLVMEVNDLPHAMRYGRSPRQFVENFDDILSNVVNDETAALLIDVTAHCHCYGRPSGAWAYEAVARKAAGRDDVWVTTKSEMAAHVLKNAG